MNRYLSVLNPSLSPKNFAWAASRCEKTKLSAQAESERTHLHITHKLCKNQNNVIPHISNRLHLLLHAPRQKVTHFFILIAGRGILLIFGYDKLIFLYTFV